MKPALATLLLAAALLDAAGAAAPTKEMDALQLQKERACRAALAQEHGACIVPGQANSYCDSAIAAVASNCFTLDRETACSAASLETQNLCTYADPADARCARAKRSAVQYCQGKT